MSSIYYHREYGQFIDLSGSEWLAPLAVAATTVVVTTLSVVLPTVGALAVSPQVTTALDGVVLSRDTLGTQTHATLQPSSGTLAAANHVELLLESGGEQILREVERLKPNGFGRNADPCGCKG